MVETTPKTKKEIEKELVKAEKQRKDLLKLRKPIDKAIVDNYKLLERLKDELALTLDLTDIKAIFKADGQAAYKARQDWAEARGLRFLGVFGETHDPALQISLNQNENTEQLKKTILEVLPLYTPIYGFVMFSIVEATLAEHGVYTLHVAPDASVAKIVKTTHGHDSNVFVGSLDEMLSLISKMLYYKGLGEED